MISRILVPTDFSEASKAALVRAEELARLTHAELLLFHVRDELPLMAYEGAVFAPGDLVAQRAALECELRELAAQVAQRGLVARTLLAFGAAAPRIVDIVEQEKIDL
ncbi:MAG: Universal stress protein family, partial [Myxococcaceae bacterium]|nr:Universal stress protein family [Myxococcaceae bacterium]